MKIESNNNLLSTGAVIATLVFLYSSVILNCTLLLMGVNSESGQLKWIYIIATIIAIGIFFLNGDSIVDRSYLVGVGFLLLILLLFFLTGEIYNESNVTYASEFKLLLAVLPCTVICPLLIEKLEIRTFSPHLILLFDVVPTFIILYAAFSANDVTSGGLITSSSGFIYQNISYYAAFTFGLSIYMLQEIKYGGEGYPPKLFIYMLIVVQAFTCLLGGGRGGFFLFIILAIYMIFTVSQNRGGSLLLLIAVCIILMLIATYATNIVENLGGNVTGIERILNALNRSGTTDSSREYLWEKGLEEFSKRPVLGNGLGSVFFLMDTYSHNCFIDMLCESGIVGTTIFIIIILTYLRKTIIDFSQNSVTRFFFMIFICGFIMNLFSGYLIVNNFILLPIFYQMTKSN